MDSPITVGSVHILIYQLDKARPIVKQVMSLNAISEASLGGLDGDTAELFFSGHDRLIELVNKSRPLVRTTSGPDGSFSLTLPAVDSVLVFAYAEQEDEPNYSSSRIMRARSASALDMEMAGAGCPNPESDRKALVSGEDIAHWRGSPVPDQIDSLIGAAISAEGEYRRHGEGYDFTGSEGAIEALRRMPKAIPRLIDCLGWSRRARATYNGARVLVGVVCHQAIAGSAYAMRLNEANASPQGIVHARHYDASIGDLRKAYYAWSEILKRYRP